MLRTSSGQIQPEREVPPLGFGDPRPGVVRAGGGPEETPLVAPPTSDAQKAAPLPPAYGAIPPSPPALAPPEVEELLGQAKVSLAEAYLLWLVLGVTGAHHFYMRRPWFGIAYFLTLGLAGFGWLVDGFRLPCLVKEANQRLRHPETAKRRSLSDAYVLWFLFGFLGFHLFYLRRPWEGVLYFLTGGVFGTGWLVDAARIPFMVEKCNERPPDIALERTTLRAFLLWLPPGGILGLHHFYLGRYWWGLLYFLTGGIGGFGWLVDLFRLHVLTDRRRRQDRLDMDKRQKTIDDAYVLWFPLGITGLHHFYLGRPGWGMIYFLTCGLGSIGWLVDLFRIPSLVRSYNKQLEAQCVIAHVAIARETRDCTGPYVGYGEVMVAPPTASYDPVLGPCQGVSEKRPLPDLPTYEEATGFSTGP